MEQKQWKQYRFGLNRLGKGNHGLVYDAYDLIKDKKVAIKESAALQRAQLEASVMKQYGNSNFLPAFYDSFILDDKAYIVMEYIEGNTINKGGLNTSEKKRGEQRSVEITINILKGLHDLHNSGFTHQDIKPKNVIIKNDLPETVKVIDFNMCKKITNIDSIQIDLQAAARMCVFLMNGSAQEFIHDVEISNDPLKATLLKAFNPKVENRYHSADEFISALIHLLDGKVIS